MYAGRVNLAHSITKTRRRRRSEWREQLRICVFILASTVAYVAIIGALDRWING